MWNMCITVLKCISYFLYESQKHNIDVVGRTEFGGVYAKD